MGEKKSYTEKEMGKCAIAYLRVSNEEQVTNFSLDNQEEYCKREAEKQGFKLLKIFREEGRSATTTNRPQLLELLNYCSKERNKISALFIYRYDRLSRDSYQALAIKHKLAQQGIDVLSCTEPSGNDPMGKFIQTLSFALAQLENDVKSQRTLDGMKKRFEAGHAHGKAPVGYLNAPDGAGRLVIVKDVGQFDLVKRGWEEMATGTHTYETIANFMNSIGIVVKRGTKCMKITNQHAQRIFRNKFYMGVLISKRWGEIEGQQEPMVNETTFYKVQAILDGKAHKTAPRERRQPDFPLRWLVKCGMCGDPLTGGWSTGRSKKYAYYYCGSRKHSCPSVPKEILEVEFVEYLHKLTPKKEFVELFAAIVKEKWQTKMGTYRIQQHVTKKELEKLEEKRQKLIDGHLEGIYSDMVYQEQLGRLENEIEAKKVVIAESRLDQIDIETLTTFMKAFLSDLSKPWVNGTLEQRQILFGSIFPEGLLYDFPNYRTARLAPFLEPFAHSPIPQMLLGVDDRI